MLLLFVRDIWEQEEDGFFQRRILVFQNLFSDILNWSLSEISVHMIWGEIINKHTQNNFKHINWGMNPIKWPLFFFLFCSECARAADFGFSGSHMAHEHCSCGLCALKRLFLVCSFDLTLFCAWPAMVRKSCFERDLVLFFLGVAKSSRWRPNKFIKNSSFNLTSFSQKLCI